MIRKILVPVDFSRGATAALRYAESFADFVKADLVQVIHVFTPQVATGSAVVVPDMGELMDQRQARFNAFLAEAPVEGSYQRRSELLLGFVADKIVEQAEDYDLIIMGSSGDTDLLEEVFGSISTEVSQQAHCPVLMVPQAAVFREYEHILYASNSLSLSRRAVLRFRDFSELFHARVHFVHVNDEEGSYKGQRESLFAPLFDRPEPEFAFEIHEVTADTVQEGLVEYLQQKPIELAVMVTRHRGFWERLFHHSDTRQMVLHPETPLLVLHLD